MKLITRRKSLLAVFGTIFLAAALSPAPATAGAADIKEQLEALPGVTVTAERPADAPYRSFAFTITQPIDHHRPDGDTFEQRGSLLFRGFDRPVDFETLGYYLSDLPYRAEVTKLIDGNQVDLEHRFFAGSRPRPADWSKLDIWQAATDHHRLVQALKPLFPKPWITSGSSKGGMTATYHRTLYPDDVQGTVAYVAPNDADNDEDSAYDDFFDEVGDATCREKVVEFSRSALKRRDDLLPLLAEQSTRDGTTFDNYPNGIGAAFEHAVVGLRWAFWQVRGTPQDCAEVPAASASAALMLDYVKNLTGIRTDQSLSGERNVFGAYCYQATTELGYPKAQDDSKDVADLTRYPAYDIDLVIPQEVPIALRYFRPGPVASIDAITRTESRQRLYVYGQNDPWSAERFELAPQSSDSYVYTAPGLNHFARISDLGQPDRDHAIDRVRSWAGLDLSHKAKSIGTSTPKADALDNRASDVRRAASSPLVGLPAARVLR